MGGLIILLVTFALMWALFILPQQRRVRQHQALVAAIQLGDEVMTTAGIYGRVTALHEDVVRLEVAPEVELRVARAAISRRITPEGPELEPGEPTVDDEDVDGGSRPAG